MAYISQYSGEEIDNYINSIIEHESDINNISTLENNISTLENNISTLENNVYNQINDLNTVINNFNATEICNILYPVGSIYTAGNENINPNTLFPNTTWELTEATNDTDYVNNYFGTTNLKVITWTDGSKWIPLVSHNVNSGNNVYASKAEALQCATEGKISNLYILNKTHDILKNSNGAYEFILEYPSLNNYNRWRQTSNPLLTTESVTGYTPIYNYWSTSSFGGISTSSSSTSTFLDCSVGTSWWYAVCSYVNYQGGIPGPGSIVTTYTNLYIRVPSLETTNILSNDYNLLRYLGCKYWRRVS